MKRGGPKQLETITTSARISYTKDELYLSGWNHELNMSIEEAKSLVNNLQKAVDKLEEHNRYLSGELS